MIYSGLVSVTFRKLAPAEIIRLVAKAGLDGIEWGGDIHVPHGRADIARDVRKMTEDTGLSVASYGSYYIAGCDEKNGVPFEIILETASALGSPAIRVWAGDKGSVQADKALREKIAVDARRIADLAKSAGLTISFEYHGNTLTDTGESAARLLKAVDRDNVFTYWQPPVGLDPEGCLAGLRLVSGRLSNIHAFCWRGTERRPLADGTTEWTKYLQTIKMLPGQRFCMIEFVRGDEPAQFHEDAATLRRLLAG